MIIYIVLGIILLLVFSIWFFFIRKPYNKSAYRLIRTYADTVKYNLKDKRGWTKEEICENLIMDTLMKEGVLGDYWNEIRAKILIKHLKEENKITDIKNAIHMIVSGFIYWKHFGYSNHGFCKKIPLTDKAKLERLKLKIYIDKCYNKFVKDDTL